MSSSLDWLNLEIDQYGSSFSFRVLHKDGWNDHFSCVRRWYHNWQREDLEWRQFSKSTWKWDYRESCRDTGCLWRCLCEVSVRTYICINHWYFNTMSVFIISTWQYFMCHSSLNEVRQQLPVHDMMSMKNDRSMVLPLAYAGDFTESSWYVILHFTWKKHQRYILNVVTLFILNKLICINTMFLTYCLPIFSNLQFWFNIQLCGR